MKVEFSINGEPAAVEGPPLRRLTRVLRQDLGLTGTKVGCDAGDCGACTVLLDSMPVNACMVPLGRVGGRSVETVESLGNSGLGPLQRSFLREGGAQCGICIPGMLMSATPLVDSVEQPSEVEIEAALGGVLCRCTGYRKIIAAVATVSAHEDPAVEPPIGKAVGAGVERVDGVPKVDGTDLFGDDAQPENALEVIAVRSPHHHALFHFKDLDDWLEAHHGIVSVLTAHDVPGRNWFGVIAPFADQPVLATRRTRYRGEAVALVVGEPEAIAALNLESFPVTWDQLPEVLSVESAVHPGSPLLHDDRPGNVLTRGLVQRGPLREAFADAHHTVEREYSTGFIEHAYIEPEAGYAVRTDDRIEVHVTTQTPHMDRSEVAAILDLSPEQVRIVPTSVGGGFGGKLDMSVQPLVALAAWTLDRPVRMTYTRPESMMSTTKRHPAAMQVRVAANDQGRLTALEFAGTFDTGAYASWGPTVANRVPVHAGGPYRYDAYRGRTVAVHTNGPPSGAFRGFGVPQSAIAQECAFDELADAVGIDRLEFRRQNALTEGTPTVTGQVFESGVGFVDCLDALQPHWERALGEAGGRAGHIRRGVGLAGMWYGCGNTALPNPSTIRVGLHRDGHIVLHQGAVDIGQGSNTVISQICADGLGVPLSAIVRIGADTDLTPDAGKTSASRQTYVSGNAAFLAGRALRDQLLAIAGADRDAQLELTPGVLIVHDLGETKTFDLGDLDADSGGLVATAEETYDPPTTLLDSNGQGDPYAVFGFGAQMAEVDVDMDLGTVTVVRMTAAHDVGRAVNPTLVEGQIEGGIAQGIGLALMEEFLPGRNENLHDYLIPTIGDVPEVVSILIESHDPLGPFGAKGIGEHSLIATAPAILNAIRHATGAAVRHLPATPDRVLAAIDAQA